MNKHPEIVSDEDIPDLCKKTFVSITNAVKTLWVVAIVIVLPSAGAGIGWSIVIGKEQVHQNDKIAVAESKLEKLENEINRKLDILIERKKP